MKVKSQTNLKFEHLVLAHILHEAKSPAHQITCVHVFGTCAELAYGEFCTLVYDYVSGVCCKPIWLSIYGFPYRAAVPRKANDLCLMAAGDDMVFDGDIVNNLDIVLNRQHYTKYLGAVS